MARDVGCVAVFFANQTDSRSMSPFEIVDRPQGGIGGLCIWIEGIQCTNLGWAFRIKKSTGCHTLVVPHAMCVARSYTNLAELDERKCNLSKAEAETARRTIDRTPNDYTLAATKKFHS